MQPAWNDDNLYDICRHVSFGPVLAHVRATTGTAVQQTNCHPFRQRRWLMIHNGAIEGLESIRCDLVAELGPTWYPHSEDMAALSRLLPPEEADALDEFSDESRAVVSEPLSDEIPHTWREIPEATFAVVEGGEVPLS